MLQNYVAHGGYTTEPMILGQVRILGVDIGPTSVEVNEQTYTQYTYTNKVMHYNNIELCRLKLSWGPAFSMHMHPADVLDQSAHLCSIFRSLQVLCGKSRIHSVFKWTAKTLTSLHKEPFVQDVWVFSGCTCNLVGYFVPWLSSL